MVVFTKLCNMTSIFLDLKTSARGKCVESMFKKAKNKNTMIFDTHRSTLHGNFSIFMWRLKFKGSLASYVDIIKFSYLWITKFKLFGFLYLLFIFMYHIN
ncbi:hypothetical protein H311_04098 [Anncaliia algerae PRA109]|nr:hypothetical protein H311_04098 [Anncaliia algerae PRA109]